MTANCFVAEFMVDIGPRRVAPVFLLEYVLAENGQGSNSDGGKCVSLPLYLPSDKLT
jgi:hypothetical protein